MSSPVSRLATIVGLLLAVATKDVDSDERTAERLVVNPHDFKYLLNNPDLCHTSGTDVHVLIWIQTAPPHFKRRVLIRETWGNPMNFRDLKVRTVFFVGMPGSSALQNELNLEFEKYGDIIEEDFTDSYRNLTYKTIMGLKWVDAHCRTAKVIMKADDDVVINVFGLVQHVKALHERGIARERTLLCRVWVSGPVKRQGKWAVSKDEYPHNKYPTYCAGPTVLMTPDLTHPLYVESLYTPYFWLEDVYLTGILAQRVNVTHLHLSVTSSPGKLKPEANLALDRHYAFIEVHDGDVFYSIWTRIATLHSNATL